MICAAGLATVRYLNRHKLVERCHELERVFFAKLSRLKGFSVVGDIRGKGLLAGIEFVKDRDTREPCARAEKFAERLTEAAFRNGLILWSNVGHVDGVNGDIVMLVPPFIITEAQLEDMVALLERSLDQVATEAQRHGEDRR